MGINLKAFVVAASTVMWIATCGCSSCGNTALDLRERLLEACRISDAEFPDGKAAKLTHFAYMGKVRTRQEWVYVVDMRYVLTGMPAPRGLHYLVFLNNEVKWIGRQKCSVQPLWCEGSRVYLFGLDEQAGKEGNVWDLFQGFESRELLISPAYGSYLPPGLEPGSLLKSNN